MPNPPTDLEVAEWRDDWGKHKNKMFKFVHSVCQQMGNPGLCKDKGEQHVE